MKRSIQCNIALQTKLDVDGEQCEQGERSTEYNDNKNHNLDGNNLLKSNESSIDIPNHNESDTRDISIYINNDKKEEKEIIEKLPYDCAPYEKLVSEKIKENVYRFWNTDSWGCKTTLKHQIII